MIHDSVTVTATITTTTAAAPIVLPFLSSTPPPLFFICFVYLFLSVIFNMLSNAFRKRKKFVCS